MTRANISSLDNVVSRAETLGIQGVAEYLRSELKHVLTDAYETLDGYQTGVDYYEFKSWAEACLEAYRIKSDFYPETGDRLIRPGVCASLFDHYQRVILPKLSAAMLEQLKAYYSGCICLPT